MDKTLREIIGQCIGEASMLWDPDGVFQSERGIELMERTVREVEALEKSND